MLQHLIKPTIATASVISLLLLSACNSGSKQDIESFIAEELNGLLINKNRQVAAVAIVSGEHTYQAFFGQLPNGEKPNSNTLFEIASITKTYTGLLLAQAVLDNKVVLDEDIRTYLGYDGYQNLQYSNTPITLRHLATHRSGLPQDFSYTPEDRKNGRVFEKIASYSKQQFFSDLSQYQLTSEPGDEYRYSNVGTVLVGYLLEKVYERPLSALVAEFITNKSGEQDTQFRLNAAEAAEITVGIDGQGKQQPLLSRYSSAEGGLTTSAASMTHYMRYLLNASSPEIALSQTLLAGSGRGHGHAFYWNTYQQNSNQPMYYLSGGSMGSSAWLVIYPKQQLGVFIVTNLAAGGIQEDLNDISNEIFERYQQGLKEI
ncbi:MULTISPECIES: serine hydrolase domain-containing protein [unclassified Pseudoalteromonas]|uniref:serine hydrolase domain-containing protein n=1 Tax=unclassified Pseudoalteromonas TaxID=194690 RepID=UPI00301521CB